MPRPNKGTDRQLIEAGKKMLLKNGMNGLTISAICKKAGVNPGMFVYNFKSKEEYLDCVLDEIWKDCFDNLVLPAESDSSYEHMEKALYFLCKASAKYPALMTQVGIEVLAGDKTLIHTLKERIGEKMRLIYPVFKQAQAEGIITKNVSLPEFMLLVWPALIYSSASVSKIMMVMPEEDKKDPSVMLSDAAVKERVRKVLRFFHPDVYDSL